MSRYSPRTPRTLVLSAVVLSFLMTTAVLEARQNPFKWLTGRDRSVKYSTYKDPAGRFQLDMPTKDWHLLPTAGSSLAVFTRPNGPALFIDHITLTERLTPAEVEAISDVELGRLKSQQPTAKDFKAEMLDGMSGRGALIQYVRPGPPQEAVVQYSVPVNQDLYRLSGVVPQNLMEKDHPVVMHMIQSFRAANAPPVAR